MESNPALEENQEPHNRNKSASNPQTEQGKLQTEQPKLQKEQTKIQTEEAKIQKEQIKMQTFGKTALFLSTYKQWAWYLAMLSQLIVLGLQISDPAYGMGFYNLGGHTLAESVLKTIWIILQTVIGFIIVDYLRRNFAGRIKEKEYSKIAEEDFLSNHASIIIPKILVYAVLFFFTAWFGGLLVLYPALLFTFGTPFKLQSWKNPQFHPKPKRVPAQDPQVEMGDKIQPIDQDGTVGGGKIEEEENN